jgi:hypothetical protein
MDIQPSNLLAGPQRIAHPDKVVGLWVTLRGPDDHGEFDRLPQFPNLRTIHVGVRATHDGLVAHFQIDSQGILTDQDGRFVNSSIGQLARCMKAFQELPHGLRPRSPARPKATIQKLLNCFGVASRQSRSVASSSVDEPMLHDLGESVRRIDPAAMADSQCWWPRQIHDRLASIQTIAPDRRSSR